MDIQLQAEERRVLAKLAKAGGTVPARLATVAWDGGAGHRASRGMVEVLLRGKREDKKSVKAVVLSEWRRTYYETDVTVGPTVLVRVDILRYDEQNCEAWLASLKMETAFVTRGQRASRS